MLARVGHLVHPLFPTQQRIYGIGALRRQAKCGFQFGESKGAVASAR